MSRVYNTCRGLHEHAKCVKCNISVKVFIRPPSYCRDKLIRMFSCQKKNPTLAVMKVNIS